MLKKLVIKHFYKNLFYNIYCSIKEYLIVTSNVQTEFGFQNPQYGQIYKKFYAYDFLL